MLKAMEVKDQSWQ